MKRKVYSDDDILFIKNLRGDEFLDYINETENGYSKKYEVKDENGKVKKDENDNPILIPADIKFRKLSDNTSIKIYRRIADKATLKNQNSDENEKFFDLFRSHNLRRFFSNTLADCGSEVDFKLKEQWMGHKLGTSENYDEAKIKSSKAEYLKIMWRLYISSDYQRDGYIQQFHKSEIEKAEMEKKHAVLLYENDIENLQSNIEGYEEDIKQIEVNLKNEMIDNSVRTYFNMQLNDYKKRVENINNSIKSKRGLLEIAEKEYEDFMDEINRKYESRE
ncbi:hypothetical protein [Methanococcoides sp. NM1]|uniref:hypothetical protein n=1 Tax=Methanococcoides sp. NM1 TaxID=1201013 RepID=UPI001082DFEF|nr:hypothetical protein [Methanococcoides sp. NM1]